MPRRKKKVKDPAEPHSVEKTEVETSSSSSVKRKRRVEDAFIVISDSEGEEPKEENGLQNTKMKQSNRAKGLAKRKIAQMTEEEQFELALQMSEQEARAVNSQEEEEEALLRKAIAESLNSSQGLFLEGTSEERNSVSASKSVATLPSKRSSVPRPEGSAEEITVCPETQLSSPETLDPEREVSSRSRETLDKVKVVMTKKEVGSGDAEKKARPSSFLSSIQVSCPLCNQGFPPAKIELHAMYCNGLVEQETVLTRRQKEARSRSLGETSDADKNEKCYLCKARVPFRDYHGHVMACLRLAKKATSSRGETSGHWQHSGSSAEGRQPPPRRQGNPKEKGRSEGRLLSVLEQSEHQTADAEVKVESSGAGTCRVPSSGMEEAGCSRERPTSLAALNLSESPIKSFVPVSEATDCLVDFKKQLAAPPGSRPRTKGGRGRRKKS
ncbi:BRCA1-A complex subunit RAP80 isoform X2 [Sorex araneus]|uniref:BRCA1-A complex subunit RAP80 isoform X2 n=1 Tax=Sorex araneus TaxID=42254 RepID=UPI002433B7D2|nr:BRCA1-A complex subunit RAP80 isoform X2 [Sorex araneus]